MSRNIVREKSYQFALDLISAVRKLPKASENYIIGNQLIRAGTSIGANIEEAEGAFSKADFTYKMNTALKEARETHYWLRLLKDAMILEEKAAADLLQKTEELLRLLTSIVKSSKA
jgi:four helix bundle protein